MKMPRYFQFSLEMPRKQSVKDLMNTEVSKLTYWKHPLWQPLVPEDEESRRRMNWDYAR
jgi:hypothetical protein